jgi:UrcA family protein
MNSNVQSTNRAFLVYSAAMLLACVLVGSRASADEQVRAETVKFQDLNVNTPAGAEALYVRIHTAAKRVCSQPGQWMPGSVSACVRNAEATAIGKLDLPLLTAFYRAKTGDHTSLIANR